MSLLELFCSVDDFWLQFAPNWQQTLVASGQRKRLRPTQTHPSTHHDHCDPVPSVPLSDMEARIIASMCSATCASRVSHLGELSTLRRVDAHRPGSTSGSTRNCLAL